MLNSHWLFVYFEIERIRDNLYSNCRVPSVTDVPSVTYLNEIQDKEVNFFAQMHLHCYEMLFLIIVQVPMDNKAEENLNLSFFVFYDVDSGF